MAATLFFKRVVFLHFYTTPSPGQLLQPASHNALFIPRLHRVSLCKSTSIIGVVSAPPEPITFEKLGRDRTGIERYIQSLINGYNAHGAARMEDYRVVELSLCKERTGSGKDYISAKVTGPGSPFYIIFQRTYGPTNLNKPITSVKPSNVTPSREPITQVGERWLPEVITPFRPGLNPLHTWKVTT